ncbi:hypothetical protein PIROE2DRAFT_6525 [Piromyces sp. E2]|nr:hypothetical protein PIROE2DRAFT_6525 [Piromyces sp. E2]|eukprot:OUM66289.1 hypothetical protein PIROE2DRAFT_6525 [Piromyces sp. E2]
MEFHNKYSSELRDEDIIPFTTEALEVVETVVSFFCNCLNKDDPKFITLTNGKLSPKKEDINLHPSLDGDPTEKICQKTSLCKNATVFQYDKIHNNNNELTEGMKNMINTSFDDCIQDTDNIINKIEDEFQNKSNYNDSLVLSSDSEDDDDGAPIYLLAARKEIEDNINQNIDKDKKQEAKSHESLTKEKSETDTSDKSPSSSPDNKEKTKDHHTNDEDNNSLDFPLDESKEDKAEINEENDGEEEEKEEDQDQEQEEQEQEQEQESDGNFNDNNSSNEYEEEENDNFEQEEDESKSSFKEQLSEEEEGESELEKEDKGNESEKDDFNEEQKIMPTPMPNLEEMTSNFSSQISIDNAYMENAQFLNDSNDEINFIPLQEKDKSNRIRWKYHIKHHSTNKKLRCCNFLIYWSQPSKINPVPKATAEMWMIYYHTSNVGRNDATITYRFNGYYNTHEINVHKFMKEYTKFKSNSYVEITKEEFPTLYTPLVLNPKKWLPELIRSKLLISNDIMNNVLVN